jgi:hypothetical protein
MEDTTVSTKKKTRKAPKIPTNELEPIEDVQTELTADQEVPVKSKKKKRAPKVAIDDEPIVFEEPVKKKKSKAPKPPPIEDDFQMIETPTIEEFEVPIEEKPKIKKSKKPKKVISEPLDDDQGLINYDLNSGISHACPSARYEKHCLF